MEKVRIKHVHLETHCAVSISGEVDLATAPALDDYLTELIAENQRDLALDLNGISFMDSSGLNVLLKVRRALEEAGLMLALLTPSPQVSRTLSISGLDQVFRIVDSHEQVTTDSPTGSTQITND